METLTTNLTNEEIKNVENKYTFSFKPGDTSPTGINTNKFKHLDFEYCKEIKEEGFTVKISKDFMCQYNRDLFNKKINETSGRANTNGNEAFYSTYLVEVYRNSVKIGEKLKNISDYRYDQDVVEIIINRKR